MTTIAFDGVTVAIDSRKSCEGYIAANTLQLKYKIIGTHLYVITGISCVLDPAIAWYKAGADPEKVPAKNKEWALMIFTKGSQLVLEYTNDVPYSEALTVPYVNGSGYRFALGALKAGASAFRAVQIAAECDSSTGGEIHEISIKTLKRVQN